jgi:hypothetical protein
MKRRDQKTGGRMAGQGVCDQPSIGPDRYKRKREEVRRRNVPMAEICER